MEAVLVCVTLQKGCERLIRAGKRFADAEKIPLHVLSVERADKTNLANPAEREALDYLYDLSRSAGAEMSVQRDNDVFGAIKRYAESIGAICVVVGCGDDGRWTFADTLRDMLNEQVLLMKA